MSDGDRGAHGEAARDGLTQENVGAPSDQNAPADKGGDGQSDAPEERRASDPPAPNDGGGAGKVPPQHQSPSANDPSKKPSPFDQALKWTDFVIAGAAVGSLATTIIMTVVACHTLTEMKSTDTVTSNAVASLAAMAGSSQNEVNAIGNEVGEIHREADNIGNLVAPAQQSANAATDQLSQLKSAQRPWISVDVKVGGPLRSIAHRQTFLPLTITLTNVGKSPAFYVFGAPRSFLMSDGHTDYVSDLEKWCNVWQNQPHTAMYTKPVLFPGKHTEVFGAAVGFGKDEIEAHLLKEQPAPTIYIYFYGCALYALEQGGDYHRTPFAFRLSHLAPFMGHISQDYSFTPYEDIPAADLIIEEVSTDRIQPN
jgi:hypothetical protein